VTGWRDAEGRTSRERAQQRGATERAQFMMTLRQRPLSLLKGLLGLVFILVLIFALIGGLR
jgi:hypothetical protein